MRLYYLCPPQFGISNLAMRRLKISRFSDLNDPFELLAVELTDSGHRQVFRALKDELNKSKGLLCFAKTWSNPLMWGHYADRHTGIALGFDVQDDLAKQVIYANRLQKIQFDQSTGKPSITYESMERLLRTKFFDWKYEDEYRVWAQLDRSTEESGLYFFNLNEQIRLREVVLGQRCTLPIDRVRDLVSSYPEHVDVHKARIAFGSFRVVKDTSVR